LIDLYEERKQKILEENLSQNHFIYHDSRMDWLGLGPGPPR